MCQWRDKNVPYLFILGVHKNRKGGISEKIIPDLGTLSSASKGQSKTL